MQYLPITDMLDCDKLYCIKSSITKTLNAKTEDGNFLMTKCRSWIAIYRVLTDKGYIESGNFMAFERLINNLFIDESLRIPINGKDLQKLSTINDVFNRKLRQWKRNSGCYSGKVFREYRDVGMHFERELRRVCA